MVTNDNSPKLGIFWFVGPVSTSEPSIIAAPRLLAVATPADQVPLVGGFRTTDPGHVDVWPSLRRQHAFLRGYPYEFFPRGRVNYLGEADQFLVLLDPTIAGAEFLQFIDREFCLPASRLVLTDSHYRTTVRCGAPIG